MDNLRISILIFTSISCPCLYSQGLYNNRLLYDSTQQYSIQLDYTNPFNVDRLHHFNLKYWKKIGYDYLVFSAGQSHQVFANIHSRFLYYKTLNKNQLAFTGMQFNYQYTEQHLRRYQALIGYAGIYEQFQWRLELGYNDAFTTDVQALYRLDEVLISLDINQLNDEYNYRIGLLHPYDDLGCIGLSYSLNLKSYGFVFQFQRLEVLYNINLHYHMFLGFGHSQSLLWIN